jgi:DnaK suppressor protein
LSKGFRDSDFAQVLSERATTGEIERILDRDREQEAHSKERMSEGAYGRCEDCNLPIGDERLAALPSATRCVKCQAASEQKSH